MWIKCLRYPEDLLLAIIQEESNASCPLLKMQVVNVLKMERVRLHVHESAACHTQFRIGILFAQIFS